MDDAVERVLTRDFEILARLALALAIGLIIGIERGWHMRDAAEGTRTAGIRTFTLIGTFGGLLGVAGQFAGDAILAVGLAGFIVFVTAAYVIGVMRTQEQGMTTEVAALITLVLGIIAVRGDMIVAAIAAVVVVTLLDAKSRMHGWIAGAKNDEIQAGIKLLLMSVVVLPLLPDRDFGPGGVLNPYKIWWIVVIIAGLSFAGYAAIRVAGPKAGAALTGLLGGLASSTAVTVSCARMAAQSPKLANPLAGAIALASGVSFARALVLSLVLYAPGGKLLIAPLVAGMAGAAAVAIYFFRHKAKGAKADTASTHIDLGPPADIETAIKFGVVLTVISLAVHYGKEWFGAAGVFATAALSGLADIDAVTITMSKFGQAGNESAANVALAVAIAVAANSVAKFGYVLVLARETLARQAAFAFAIPVGLGIAAFLIVAAA